MTQRDYPGRGDEDLCAEITSTVYTSKFARESDRPASIRVVEAVAEAIDTDPTDLEPLYEVIDPDGIDLLFDSPHGFTSGCLRFRFAGCDVTVSAAGWIAVSGMNDRE